MHTQADAPKVSTDLCFEILTIVLGWHQGTAIRDRIQERLRVQQLKGLIYDEEVDDEYYEDSEEEEEEYYDYEEEKWVALYVPLWGADFVHGVKSIVVYINLYSGDLPGRYRIDLSLETS